MIGVHGLHVLRCLPSRILLNGSHGAHMALPQSPVFSHLPLTLLKSHMGPTCRDEVIRVHRLHVLRHLRDPSLHFHLAAHALAAGLVQKVPGHDGGVILVQLHPRTDA